MFANCEGGGKFGCWNVQLDGECSEPFESVDGAYGRGTPARFAARAETVDTLPTGEGVPFPPAPAKVVANGVFGSVVGGGGNCDRRKDSPVTAVASVLKLMVLSAMPEIPDASVATDCRCWCPGE